MKTKTINMAKTCDPVLHKQQTQQRFDGQTMKDWNLERRYNVQAGGSPGPGLGTCTLMDKLT